MDNRGVDQDPGWINRRFRGHDRDIEAIRSERRLGASTISDGDLTVEGGGSVVVKGGGGVAVNDGGDITVTGGGSMVIQGGGDLTILDTNGNTVFSAADGPVRTTFKQVDLNSVDLAAAWTTYCATTVPVPAGYTKAIVQMATAAGTTIDGTGAANIGVQPVVASNGGPALSQGKTGGGAVSISSSMAIQVPVTSGGTLSLHASAYSNGDPKVAGSGNVHLSATVIFTRT